MVRVPNIWITIIFRVYTQHVFITSLSIALLEFNSLLHHLRNHKKCLNSQFKSPGLQCLECQEQGACFLCSFLVLIYLHLFVSNQQGKCSININCSESPRQKQDLRVQHSFLMKNNPIRNRASKSNIKQFQKQ